MRFSVLLALCGALAVACSSLAAKSVDQQTMDILSRMHVNFDEERELFELSFRDLSDHLQCKRERKASPPTTPGDSSIGITCGICKMALNIIFNLIENGKTDDEIAGEIVGLCTALNIEKDYVCQGAIDRLMNEVSWLARRNNFTTEVLCGLFIGGDCMTQEIADEVRWYIEMPITPKPPVVDVPTPPEGSPTLRVLQLTDIHIDPLYVEGSLADCGDPNCCQSTSGDVLKPEQAAWQWGDYRYCDQPMVVFDYTLKYLSENYEFDYIMFTGDAPSHAIWKHTREEVIFSTHTVLKLLAYYFPDTPVFPAVGNHEAMPINSFPPPQLSPQWSHDWFYEFMTEDWMMFLPQETNETVRKGGFYSTLARPGLRIISINSNYGNNENWWGLMNVQDPGNMLAWFADELDKAERNNEKVHVLAHIPTISLMQPFRENWHRIINRYESTIMGLFHGHTHYDQFELQFDCEDKTRPISVGYVAPSFTTWHHLNPAFRIYTVDGDRPNSTFAILDAETYFMNLTESQMNGKPSWQFLYSAKDTYGMQSLQPKDWLTVYEQMRSNNDTLDMYYRLYTRGSDFFAPANCDSKCHDGILNEIALEPPCDGKYVSKEPNPYKC